ncbi:ATP-binding cassette domain-containing protein, partial [Klebsiella pneumoniae]|nr:ATP-binding cassette domain-containing protein [Klebsiella pneumoniae]
TFVLDAATLTKTFPGRGAFPTKMRAVDEAELRVPENAIVGLVGESGSGKSTLLRCIAGLETPDQGTLRFLGLDLPTDLASRRR